jgi:ABC-2 type transport system permease protein
MLKINKILSVAVFSFKELVKGKFLIFSAIGFFAIILITFISAEFSYGDPARVATDIGLGILSITSVLIAAIVGQSILYDEIESRTIYMMITRPITRTEFLLGKILGLVFLVLLNIVILSLATILMVQFFEGKIATILFYAISFLFMESLIVILWALTMSLMSSRLITGISTFVMYFAGHLVGDIKETSLVKNSALVRGIVNITENTFPMLYKINLKNYVIYPTQLPENFIAWGWLYAITYVLFLILFATYLFNRKELD